MYEKVYKGILVIVVIVFIAFVSKVVYDLNVAEKDNKIEQTRDTRLNEYRLNKTIALKYTKLLNMSNESDYQELKKTSLNYASEEIRNDFFYNENYELGERDVNITTSSIKGTKTRKGVYEFKLDLKYTETNGTISYSTYMLTIVGGKITEAFSLGV